MMHISSHSSIVSWWVLLSLLSLRGSSTRVDEWIGTRCKKETLYVLHVCTHTVHVYIMYICKYVYHHTFMPLISKQMLNMRIVHSVARFHFEWSPGWHIWFMGGRSCAVHDQAGCLVAQFIFKQWFAQQGALLEIASVCIYTCVYYVYILVLCKLERERGRER